MILNNKQKEALASICDAFIPTIIKPNDPTGYWSRKASDIPVVEKITEIISSLPLETQKEFIDLINILNSNVLGLTWWGSFKSVSDLNANQREKLLLSWSKSSLPLLRNGYNSIKKLVSIIYFSYTNEGVNPNWELIGYPGPFQKYEIPISKTNGIKTEVISKDKTISCDVVVIGSGAGGGVMASELVKKGYDVIVLEKGSNCQEEAMTGNELEMLSKMYDRKGAFTTRDGSTLILAGSCLGGGTTVNWSASFRTPDYILNEWAKEHDNPHFLDDEYKKCFEFIEQKTNINTDLSIHNPQNQALVNGAKKLGYHFGKIPRNVKPPSNEANKVKYWKAQGFGGLGDSWGYKQGTLKTFLQDAFDEGARIFTNTRALKVEHRNGEITGVLAQQNNANNISYSLKISCKKVVVSGGALHTPVILKQSGLTHPQIGKNLYLHPVNAVSALYGENMDAWYGPMMSAVSDEFIRLSGNFGYKIETPPLHSGFSALATPWTSGEDFKTNMLNIRKLGTFIVLTRDKYGGKVKVSKEGRPIVDYKLNPFDKNHLIHGIKECVKIHAAAGAKKIRLLHNQMYECDIKKDNLDQFIDKIGKINWAKNRFIMYSAHQMGTCRMGGRAKDHPLKPTGETREIKNLFVADASAFPRCSGVNPMLSIQALAYYISKHI